jgi:hypothetical protein
MLLSSKHTELIRLLRTATAIGYKLQKGRMINPDLLDALRIALKGYNIK